jgi:hypothetical protein
LSASPTRHSADASSCACRHGHCMVGPRARIRHLSRARGLTGVWVPLSSPSAHEHAPRATDLRALLLRSGIHLAPMPAGGQLNPLKSRGRRRIRVPNSPGPRTPWASCTLFRCRATSPCQLSPFPRTLCSAHNDRARSPKSGGSSTKFPRFSADCIAPPLYNPAATRSCVGHHHQQGCLVGASAGKKQKGARGEIATAMGADLHRRSEYKNQLVGLRGGCA